MQSERITRVICNTSVYYLFLLLSSKIIILYHTFWNYNLLVAVAKSLYFVTWNGKQKYEVKITYIHTHPFTHKSAVMLLEKHYEQRNRKCVKNKQKLGKKHSLKWLKWREKTTKSRKRSVITSNYRNNHTFSFQFLPFFSSSCSSIFVHLII